MLQPGERLDYLIREDLRIIQNDAVFSFSTDALLLGHFTEVRKRDRILDMCAGNGVIPLLLSDKGNNVITGVEIQPQLVDMAERSIQYNHLEDCITMVEMDINALIQAYAPAQFDLITCNPLILKRIKRININLKPTKLRDMKFIVRWMIVCVLAIIC